jgi:hypothetical protein
MKLLPAIFIFSIAILLIACDKDKYETKPRLEIKDYNSKFIDVGQSLLIRINYFDKEGDLSGGEMIGIRQRVNIFPPTPAKDLVDTFRVILPEFPKEEKGEISFELPHNRLNESSVENDSMFFRFAVTDLAGNKSDTIDSDIIVVQFTP